MKSLSKEQRLKAGHYEILGETYAKFEFFENGWNPYSRFLDVDKVDLILRKSIDGKICYREVQVKYGKLYSCTRKWEKPLFDYTSWCRMKKDEFDRQISNRDFYICFVFAFDEGYKGDILIMPARDMANLLRRTTDGQDKINVRFSHSRTDNSKWYFRLKPKVISLDSDMVEATQYHRNFEILNPSKQ